MVLSFDLTTDIDHDTITNNHNLTTDINHSTITGAHNLTTDIDHDQLTNTHDLTTSIDHNTITNNHNLTTDIDHNTINNHEAGEHRVINDAGTLTTELWSASKIGTDLGGKSDTGHPHTASDVTDFDTEVGNHTDVDANTTARHAQSHDIASHSDTTATGTQLNTLVGGGETTLHSHAGGGDGDTIAADNEAITGLWNFMYSGAGGLTDYDITIGDVTTPDYGIVRIGNSIIGRTSYNVSSLDLDGAFIIRNVGSPATSNIEFAFAESSNSVRFAIPKSGAGNATYNPRSMLVAGPAPDDDTMVTVGYWQGQGIFDNLACDTGTDGADLGVQNDLEVEGDIFCDNLSESTTDAGITIDGLLIKDSGIPEASVTAHEGALTVTASQVSDFDTEVGNHTDVDANTTARHAHSNKTELDLVTDGDHDVISSGNPHSVTASDVSLGNLINELQVSSVVNTWTADYTDKAAPATGDFIVIEDSDDSYNKKRIQVGNLPSGGGGEINTASSAGSGVSLYYTKATYDLQFNAIKSENNILGIALDGGTHDIELTVDEGNITHDNLSGVAANEHIDWTSATDNIVTTGSIDTSAIDLNGNVDMTAPSMGQMRFTNKGAGPGLDNYLNVDCGEAFQWGTTLSAGGSGGNLLRLTGSMTSSNTGMLFGDQSTCKIVWYDPGGTSDACLDFRTKTNGGNDATGLVRIVNYSAIPTQGTETMVDPHLRVYGGTTSITDYIEFYHDQTDGHIKTAAGDINMTPTGGEVNITGGITVSTLGGDVVGTTESQTLTQKILTTPTIGDFTNAAHDHSNAIGGSVLDHADLTAGSGTDHSYIDQDVTSASTPTFTGTNFTGIPWTGVSKTSSKLSDLADVPAYTGNGGEFYRVNSGATAPETVSLDESLQIQIELTVSEEIQYVVPFDMSVTGWTMLLDASGSAAIDVWKDTYANHPPVDADSWVTPSVTTAAKNQATGLSLTCTKGECLIFHVDSVTTATLATLALTGVRT